MAPFFLLLACIAAVGAQSNDMKGQLFLFANQSIHNYVILKPTMTKPLNVFTVCLRTFTEVPQYLALLSASSAEQDNDIRISFGDSAEAEYSIGVGGQVMPFSAFPTKLDRKHICVTWSSATGVAQLWVNSKALARKVMKKGYSIPKDLKIILGQAPNSHEGSFHKKHAFLGEIGDVHMWDEVVFSSQIYQAMIKNPYLNGDVINWRSLSYEIIGDVLVQPCQ